MSSVHPVLFEQSIANLLTAAGFRLVALKRDERPFDFIFEDFEGKRTAIKASAAAPDGGDLQAVVDHLRYATTGIDRFFLVTSKPPGVMQKRRFAKAFQEVRPPAEWIGGNALTASLGLGDEIDLSAPETLDGLQMAAITSNLETYLDSKKVKSADQRNLSRVIVSARRRITDIPQQYSMLRRQFPFSTIKRLSQKDTPLADQLLIGGHIDDVTVVMSDLKNFSHLVTQAGEEPLKRIMSQYYKRSRELVWAHGGVLDKFVGDAVLAIFNYPYMRRSAPMRAVAFARDLIGLGRDVMGRLSDTMETPVETGTRVGVCSGELWILDIGQDEIEVSFFGDIINLSARLEHNARTDALLMDDATRLRIAEQDPGLIDLLAPERIDLRPSAVKGQAFAVKAWQVPFDAIQDVEIVPDKKRE